MKLILPQSLIDRWFRIVVLVKGIDGGFEILGGILLLVIPLSKLHGALAATTYELLEGHHAFIANYIHQLDDHLTAGIALFGALYLTLHGGVKITIAAALWLEKYHWYPYAIGLLTLSIFYQSYRVGLDHSWWLGVLTVFDTVIVVLTYLEWRRHTANGGLKDLS